MRVGAWLAAERWGIQGEARDLFLRLLAACHSNHGRVKSAAQGAFCGVMREVNHAQPVSDAWVT